MRLRVSVFLLVGILAASVAQAQQVTGFIESFNVIKTTGTTTQINIWAKGPIKDKVGWSLWSLTSESWSEAYAGLTFAPTSWVAVSASLGLESDADPLRVGGSVWVGKGRWSLLSIHESGGSGRWHRNIALYQATKTVAIGVDNIRFFGTGLHAEKKFGKVTLWGTCAVNKGIAGARFNF